MCELNRHGGPCLYPSTWAAEAGEWVQFILNYVASSKPAWADYERFCFKNHKTNNNKQRKPGWAQQVKFLATKSDDLSSVPRIHMSEENQLLKVHLLLPHSDHSYAYPASCTHKTNKCNLKNRLLEKMNGNLLKIILTFISLKSLSWSCWVMVSTGGPGWSLF